MQTLIDRTTGQLETKPEHEALWRGLRNGAADAQKELAELVRQVCEPMLRRLAPRDVPDLLQETFLSALEYARKPGKETPRVLAGFLRYRAKGVLKKHRAALAKQAAASELGDPIAKAAEKPWELVSVRELQEALAECMQFLTRNERRVLELRCFQGLDNRTAAARLGTLPATAAVWLNRARRSLLQRLRAKKLID